MNKVFLGLGSNLNNRKENLEKAILVLKANPKIEVINESSLYETAPYGYKKQDDFLNIVIEINTSILPSDLLVTVNEIEDKLGRKRVIHWGPRTIDIDILLYGNEVIQLENLKIPHPQMNKRLFVLIPLLEIYKGKIPGEVKTIPELISSLSVDSEGIKKCK